MYIYIYSIYIIPIFPSYSKHVNHLQFYRFTIGYTPTELLGTGTGSANHQVMLVDIDGFYMAPLNGHGDWLPDFDAFGKLRQSRRFASFLTLSTSEIEDVSQNCFVFDVVKFRK